MKGKIVGFGLLISGFILVGVVTFQNTHRHPAPLVFAKSGMLSELWNTYKREYVDSSGRTLDKQRDSITTSEGQSYTLLRAVWQDDKTTFDQIRKFSKGSLKRQEDHLSAWMFGQRPDKSYGILIEKGGQNTASDGDQDTALALTFASARWQQQEYLSEAKQIVGDIWNEEVVSVAGKPILVANNLERQSPDTIVVNPSYLAPATYRIFAKIDPTHDWNGLADNSYAVLNQATTMPLDTAKSANIPPDWILIKRQTGQVLPPNQSNLHTTFGYDALRVSWRVALDWEWNRTPQAKALLDKFSFLREEWKKRGAIQAGYNHDGQSPANYEAPAFYGGSLGYFMVSDPKAADAIYEQKLKSLYDPNMQSWKQPLSYYDDNWAWFGLALHDHAVPNLAKGLK